MSQASVAVPGFKAYVGQHCETVATGSLLGTAGVHLSEPTSDAAHLRAAATRCLRIAEIEVEAMGELVAL